MTTTPHMPGPDRAHHWLQLGSGRRFTFEGPVEVIDIEDVAGALAKLCRFGGATTEFYSVAQHSCLVADLALGLPEARTLSADQRRTLAVAAMLHDAHEMVLADICRPTKWWLADTLSRSLGIASVGHVLSAAEAIIDQRLAEALGVSDVVYRRADVAHLVKAADNMALAIERRDLMTLTDEVWHGIPTAAEIADQPVIKPWPWRAAVEAFMIDWQVRVVDGCVS